MSVVLSRVDNRLVHGQVLEAWIPKLDVTTVLVVDDGVAGDPLRQTIMEIAVPARIDCRFVRVDELKETLDKTEAQNQRIMVLFSGIRDVRDVLRMGVPLERINIGNVHYQKGKKRITPHVSLDDDETAWLMEIQRRALVEIQSLPDDPHLRFPDVLEKTEEAVGDSQAKGKWWGRFRSKLGMKRD